MANLARMRQAQEKVKRGLAEARKVVVVLSAMAGETNRLLGMAEEWAASPDLAECDSLISTGEQISTALFSILLRDGGIRARSVLGFQVPILTDEDYGKARIRSIDDARLSAWLQEYDVLVVAGFQGVTDTGRVSTLGRGGSDTTAVAVAAALKADMCEIYTDVAGVYTADPHIVSNARKLDRITYEDMLEMASMGAKVLEIRAVEFADIYDVPVHVRSTFIDAPGTLLIRKEDITMEHIFLSGVTQSKDQARITLRHCPDRPGVSAGIFGPLAQAGVAVDMIVQNPSRDGVTDMTFTLPRKDLQNALAVMEEVRVKMPGMEVLYGTNVCKVSLIGVGMRNHSGVAAKAFQTLARENINILMISTSEIKISCLIEEKYMELAVRALHDAFELGKVKRK